MKSDSPLLLRLSLLLFFLFAAGCERRNGSAEKDQPLPLPLRSAGAIAKHGRDEARPSQNGNPKVRSVPTPDETALERAKKALDDGDIFEAMKLSRGLLDSKEAFVRSSLVDIFRWVGKRALPELSELVRDGDPGVAHEALVAWEFVLQEVHHDFAKVTAITNLASSIDNPAVIDAVFMHIINVESRYSLPALEGLVMEYKGKTCCQCAKRMFEHIAGEPWSSPERTLAILKKEGEVK